jgi:hypothetical protein
MTLRAVLPIDGDMHYLRRLHSSIAPSAVAAIALPDRTAGGHLASSFIPEVLGIIGPVAVEL